MESDRPSQIKSMYLAANRQQSFLENGFLKKYYKGQQ